MALKGAELPSQIREKDSGVFDWEPLIEERLENLSTELPFEIKLVSPHTANGYAHWLKTGADLLFFTGASPTILGINRARIATLSSTSRGKVTTRIKEVSDTHVIAGIIPQEDEQADQLYERSQRVLRTVISSAGWKPLLSQIDNMDFQPNVVILDKKQLSSLTKEGGLYLKPYLPGVEPATLTRCINLLQQQVDQLGLSDQVRLQVCQPVSGEIEIILQLARDTADRRLSRFSGFPVDVLGLGKSEHLVEVKNTIGFKLFPNDMPFSERLSIMGGQKDLLRGMTDINRARATSVNEDLLEYWQEAIDTGQDFFLPSNEESPFSVPVSEVYTNGDGNGNGNRHQAEESQKPEYGVHNGRVTQIEVVLNEIREMSIGSIPGTRLVLTYADGTQEEIYLDFGGLFDVQELSGVLKPSLSDGLVPFADHLPRLPGVYRLQLLLATAKIMGKNFLDEVAFSDPENDLHQFTILDLFSRLSNRDFAALCQNLDSDISQKEIDELKKELEGLLTDDSRYQKVKPILLLISHFHLDHIGLAAMLTARIPHAFLGEADPIARYLFERGSSWMNEVVYRRYRQQDLLIPAEERSDTKRVQRNYSPPLHSFIPYEAKFVGRGNVLVVSLPCDHSMYGATMFLIIVLDELGEPIQKILYTGDFRLNDTGLTEQALEIIQAMGGVDTCISETTNLGGDSRKSSQLVTKEKQQQAYLDVMKKARGPVIVQADAKDMGLMMEIMEAAQLAGRDLILSEAHASLAMSFEDRDRQIGYKDGDMETQRRTKKLLRIYGESGLDTEANMLIPHPRVRLGTSGGINVKFRPQGKGQLNTLERELRFYHREEMVDFDDLESGLLDGRRVVIFVPPYFSLKSVFKLHAPFLRDAAVIRAHFYPYQEEAQKLLGSDQAFCRKNRWKFNSDYYIYKDRSGFGVSSSPDPKYRRSGHSTEDELLGAFGDLYRANPNMQLVPVHGLHRYNTVSKIKGSVSEQLGLAKQELKIAAKVTKGEWRLQLL